MNYPKNQPYFAYLDGQVTPEDHDTNRETTTPAGRIAFVFDCFHAEYYIEGQNVQKSLASWLGGLPSCINLPYYNDDILALVESMDSEPTKRTKDQEYTILSNYFSFMANKLLQLQHWHNRQAESYGVEL